MSYDSDSLEPGVSLREALGLFSLRSRLRESLLALRGERLVPPSRFGPSSLALLRPRIAWPLWRGRPYLPRKVILTCLFNHRQTPAERGWSVRRTQVEDYRGQQLSYDSHNGTDLSVPVGTPVLAPAPALVAHISDEYNRGGLKILLDHGEGLMTTSAHLARSLVEVGQVLRRGERMALSGYSGLDGLSTFPFGVPHVHFNTWLDGVPVDPFPRGLEPSLWRAGEMPRPWGGEGKGSAPEPFEPSEFSAAALEASIASCRCDRTRLHLESIPALDRRAAETLFQQNYYPTRFARRVPIYVGHHPRRPRLDLPFPRARFDGAVFVDALDRAQPPGGGAF
ncbi:MAG: M23 family metallopeptidase [Myxococcales bacterium]|nr:M23 family metallopeptidase [Myxococcales bacterium]